VNCRNAPWARAFTSTAPARSTIQASACRQLPSPKIKKKSNEKPKARKHDHSWASAEIFQVVQGQRVVYHFQIADDQCSL